jgi:hypothetical protein
MVSIDFYRDYATSIEPRLACSPLQSDQALHIWWHNFLQQANGLTMFRNFESSCIVADTEKAPSSTIFVAIPYE